MRKWNKFPYSVWPRSKESERTADGFRGGNISTDGTLICGDRGDRPAITRGTGAARTSYMKAGEFRGYPDYLSHEEMYDLTSRKASSKKANDGWFWDEAT